MSKFPVDAPKRRVIKTLGMFKNFGICWLPAVYDPSLRRGG
jgi:hypothetical protein